MKLLAFAAVVFFVGFVESKEAVLVTVQTEKPLVTLTCQLAASQVTGCVFRSPAGSDMRSTAVAAEARYTFTNTANGCSLVINEPLVADLGLWRCAVETTQDTHYGFLAALCPWAMSVPAIAEQVVAEPTLAPQQEFVSAVEGDSVTLSCSVQSAIRYCYFRTQNGGILNASPGTSGLFEYAGVGLDAGECSIRFPSIEVSHSGPWSCHVGFNDASLPEQRASLSVSVEELMVAQQYHIENHHNTLVVEGYVHSKAPLDYCRFVRIDGHGFTSQNVPTNYVDHSFLPNGRCEIRVTNPTILDMHPWTVVLKVTGHDVEISRSTTHTISMPDPEDTPLPPSGDSTNYVMVWSCVIVVSMALLFVGVMFGFKGNRKWTMRRASAIRNSFVKQPLPVDTVSAPSAA